MFIECPRNEKIKTTKKKFQEETYSYEDSNQKHFQVKKIFFSNYNMNMKTERRSKEFLHCTCLWIHYNLLAPIAYIMCLFLSNNWILVLELRRIWSKLSMFFIYSDYFPWITSYLQKSVPCEQLDGMNDF